MTEGMASDMFINTGQACSGSHRFLQTAFIQVMAALGTRDGREILRDFGKLYEQGRLKRLQDGRYTLNGGG